MRTKTPILLVATILLFVTFSQAQRYRIQNGIGIYGGLTQYDLNTDDLITNSGNGWLIGLAATVDLPHKWYNLSYNIQLSENQLGVLGAPTINQQPEFIDYKLFAAQVALIGHIKVFKNYFTIDAGPMIQYNGNLDLKDDSKENYIIEGFNTITANDLSEISRFNVNGTIGAAIGFDNFKLRAQYIYGFLNSFNKTNSQNVSENIDFKGNQSMLVFGAMVVF
ncbi:MAG: hypothetical protein ED556_02885 [Winogradskyella sp.]|uniref:hypothetical protein n=1 Tax=Winogradskyella sp. TaxID=1883156 RepID=UPI000F3E82A3|nr:hypothetical protein [Winogradskyella sp.]RNC88146.1 MAG: hypothetical protein ED556_02885 [Winogradskyella sp.]